MNLQQWFLETESEQIWLMQTLGLTQQAQQYGNGNITIGIVDDELRNSIQLMTERPLVFCSNARDGNDEDLLEVKSGINDYLENAVVRGINSEVSCIGSETPNANVLKIIYEIKDDLVSTRILIFKNKIKINEAVISTKKENLILDIINAVKALVK